MATTAFAGPGTTTYQARIVKPDGFPLEANSVNFKFTILNPLGTCILYSETYSAINMASTGGVISFSLGSGLKVYPTSATTFAEVFSNVTPNLSCDVGGPVSYSPGANDVRKIVMQFHDGGGWQTLPAMSINAVPYAMYANEAQKLSGLTTCNPGEALSYNGANFSCLAVGGGGVTSATVTAALGYTPADGASVTTIASNISTVSSTVFSVSSTVSSLANTVSTLQNSVAASFAAFTSSQWVTSGSTISYNAGNLGIGTANPLGILHVAGVSPVFFERVGNAAHLIIRTASGSVGAEAAVASGAILGRLSFQGHDGTAWSSNATAGIEARAFGDWTGSSKGSMLKFRTTPASSTVAVDRVTIDSNGNVGIGIAAPSTKLEVSGGVRISMETASCNSSYAGTIRYNSGIVEYCNGTSWSAFGVAGAGITLLNGSTSATQSFVTGISGANFGITTLNGVHTFNIPLAASGAVTAGLLSNADYVTFSNKVSATSASVISALGYTPASATSVATLSSNLATVSASVGTVQTNINSVSSSVASLSTSTAASFAAITSSQWVSSGSAISYNSGNVGVGTDSPQMPLHVNSTLVSQTEMIDTGQGIHWAPTYVVTKLTPTASAAAAASGASLVQRSGMMSWMDVPANATDAVTNINGIAGYVTDNSSVTTANNQLSGADLEAYVTGSGKTVNGVQGAITWAQLSGSSTVVYLNGSTNWAYQTSGTVNNMYGISANARTMTGARTLTSYAVAGNNTNTGGNVTTQIGANLTAPINGGGTTATRIGLYLPNPAGTPTTADYAIKQDSTVAVNYLAGRLGMGITSPTAKVQISAGSATVAPLKLTSGTLLTTPQSGTIEYDGNNLYYTDGTNVRRTLSTATSASVISALGYTPADKANNLSDLASSATARTNLGLGSFATASSLDLGSASATGTLAEARLPSFASVTSGTQYTKVTVDGKGRVISGAQLALSDVTTALGYTPASASASSQWTASGSTIHYLTGNVGIGTSSPAAAISVVANGSSQPDNSMWINTAGVPLMSAFSDSSLSGSQDLLIAGAHNSAGTRPVFIGRKSRGTLVSPTALATADTVASFLGSGYDGNAFANSGSIDFVTSGAISSGTLGMDILFKTGVSTRTERVRIDSSGYVGIGTSAPTALLQIKAGTSQTAQLKLGPSVLLTSPQSGAIEYDGTNLYFTDSSNARRTIAAASGTGNYDNVNVVANSSGNIALFPNAGAGSVIVSATTASINSQTGALIVNGGVGVAENLFASGSIITNSNLGVGTGAPAYPIDVSATTAIRLPIGTTAQRPAAASGIMRFNSDTKTVEYNDGTSWTAVSQERVVQGANAIENLTFNDGYQIRQYTNSGGAKAVYLPDGSTLPIGWNVTIQNISTAGPIISQVNVTTSGTDTFNAVTSATVFAMPGATNGLTYKFIWQGPVKKWTSQFISGLVNRQPPGRGLTLAAGTATNGSGLTASLSGSSGYEGNGGAVSINAGSAGTQSGSAYYGGNVSISAGSGNLTGDGGTTSLYGGFSSDGAGGNITISGGNNGNTNNFGGNIYLTGGSGKTKGQVIINASVRTPTGIASMGTSAMALNDYSMASGTSAMSLGAFSEARADYSTAMGIGTVASGLYSTSMGNNSTASGINSLAFGQGTIASGYAATAFGFGTLANGQYSTAFGAATKANGDLSMAYGTNTMANGDYSTAAGLYTVADSYASFVIGQYNVGGGNANSWSAADPVFEIGIGASGSTFNAMTVLKNGYTGLSVSHPVTMLEVAGGIKVGYESSGCMATFVGTLRYNAGSIELCNGSSWAALGGGGGTLLGGRSVSSTAPSNGQILTWNAAINSWEPATSGASAWSTSGTALYYNTGNVGVGTANPTAKFQVQADSTYTGLGGGQFRISGNSNQNIRLEAGINTSTSTGFLQAYTNGGSVQPIMLNPDGGNVGIGIATGAGSKLHVNGDIRTHFTSQTMYTNNLAILSSSADMNINYSTAKLFFNSNTVSAAAFTSAGRLGLGTSSPSTVLDIYKTNSNADIALRINNSIYDVNFTMANSVATYIKGVYGSGDYRFTDASYSNYYKVTSGSIHTFYAPVNNPMMGIDSTGVGIGTATPSFQFDVQTGNAITARYLAASNNQYSGATHLLARARGSVGSMSAVQNADTIGGLYFRAHNGVDVNTTNASVEVSAYGIQSGTNRANYMIFETTLASQTARGERMRIAETGFVGIGNSNPNNALTIGPSGSQPANYGVYVASYRSTAGQGQYVGNWTSSDWWGIGPSSASSDNTIRIGNTSDRTGTWSSTQNLNLNVGGYVGIGVNGTPARHLVVSGTNATEMVIEQSNALTNYKRWNFVVDSGNATTPSRFYIRQLNDAGSGGSVAMTITASGNMGVATQSPSEKLHVVGNIRAQGTVTDCTIGNGSGGTSCSSDARLKNNIKPIPYALDKINALKGVEFDWNEKSLSNGRHDIGVIAQDVETVFPTAVMTDKSTGYKKVDYAVLVAPIIQAVKELYLKVTQLFEQTDKNTRAIASLEEKDAAKDQQIKALTLENERKDKELREMKERLDRIEKALDKK